MSVEEHAQSVRGPGSFPAEWGPPQGRQDSEERAAWVRSRVEQYGKGSTIHAYRKLAVANRRLLVTLRAAELKAREKGPMG